MIEKYKIEQSKNNPLRYQRLYVKAESDSTSFDYLRQEFLEYTFPAYSGARNSREDLGKRFSIELYDSTTLESANGMSQYIKSTLMPDWKTWAKISPEVFIEEMQTLIDKVYDKVNKMLFSYLNISNFSQESGIAINNLVGCGTGALKIMEGDINNPFVFSFVPLKNLSILEGHTGKVEKIFYKHTEMTVEKLMNTWSLKETDVEPEYNSEEDFFDWEKEYTVIESCIYLGKYVNQLTGFEEDVFHYLVTDESFNKVYTQSYMNYNPFIIVRWNKRDDKTSWGHPIIADILPNIKTLNEAVKFELMGAERSVNPPIFFRNVQATKGEFKIQNGTGYYMPMGADIMPVNFTGNYNLSLIKTQELRESIKNAFINLDSVFATDRNTYKTAEEIARQHYEFTKRYSTVYGKIEKEFLSPVLLSCFEIMKKMQLLPNLPASNDEEAQTMYDLMTKVKISYINPLKNVEDQEKVQSFMSFLGVVSQTLGQEATQMIINPTRFLDKLVLYTDIERDFIRTEQEMQEVMNAQAQIESEIGGNVNGDTGQNTETAPQQAQ